MYDDGYHNIVNIDISESVIRQMKEDLDAKGKKMQWLVMDGTQMGFESRRFDVVVDKGTLDAVICGRDLTISDRMLEEVSRVVKPTGKIIVITHSPPEGRKKVFQKSLPFELFDYTFTKLPLSDVAMLINLMRSNLKDKPLKSILSEKEALQRSMLEYRLIQFRKKQKKPVKYYVSWGEYEGREEVGGGGAGGGKEEERGGGKV
jgi:ubiquinone/menaquinone biosynthesis C-methylase UbiE